MARGKGIYKRGNVYWLRYADSEGKMHYESSGSEVYYIASDLLLSKRNEVKDGKLPIKYKKVTFFTLADEYIKIMNYQRAFKSKRTIIKHLKEHFGDIKLIDFNTKAVEEFKVKLMSTRRPATVNRHLATLSHMFSKASTWEMVEEGINKKVKCVKPLYEDNQRLRFLTVQECKDLINAASDSIKPIIIIGLNTGLRRANILSLSWDSIDLNNNMISIKTSKNNEVINIPMNDQVKQTIINIPRVKNQNHLFCGIGGKVRKTVCDAFDKACIIAGLKDVTFHTLRHTFGSHLAIGGTDIITIKELMHHKSIKVTMRYMHLQPSSKTQAIANLNNVFKNLPTIQSTVQV